MTINEQEQFIATLIDFKNRKMIRKKKKTISERRSSELRSIIGEIRTHDIFI